MPSSLGSLEHANVKNSESCSFLQIDNFYDPQRITEDITAECYANRHCMNIQYCIINMHCTKQLQTVDDDYYDSVTLNNALDYRTIGYFWTMVRVRVSSLQSALLTVNIVHQPDSL